MKFKFLAMPALAVLLLAACNNETINQSPDKNFPADGQVRITTDINNSSSSFSSTKKTLRDGMPSQFEGNKLRLTINYNGLWTTVQDNIEWTKDEANNWTPASQMLWKDDNTPCDVYAAAPNNINYVSGDSPTILLDAETDQTKGVANSDLVVYTQLGKPASEILQDGHLPINFSHKMTQLTIKIKDKTGQSGLKIAKIELENCHYDVRFNCKTGKLLTNGYTKTITMDSLQSSEDIDGYFKAIFGPTDYNSGARFLKITDSNNKVYYYSAGAKGLKFESGKSYTLNLRLGQDAVSIDNKSLTLNDWDNGGDISDDGGDVSVMEIGDFINEDGTTSKTYIKDQSVGLVFWIGDPSLQDKALKRDYPSCTHGLAIALTENGTAKWQNSTDSVVDDWIKTHVADKYETTRSNEEYNTKGYNNTMALKAYNAAHSDKPEFIVNAVSGLTSWNVAQPSGASPWYLPSEHEAILLFNRSAATTIARLDTQLQSLINQGINADLISNFIPYWCSTEYSNYQAFTFDRDKIEFDGNKKSSNRIRYFLAF